MTGIKIVVPNLPNRFRTFPQLIKGRVQDWCTENSDWAWMPLVAIGAVLLTYILVTS